MTAAPPAGSSTTELQPAPTSARLAAAPHLVAGAVAGILAGAGLALLSWSSDRLAARHIYALAGSRDPQKSVGLALQREAFRHDDLLPLFGTSEVDRPSLYHARDLFANAPTGFSVFTVGRRGGLIFNAVESVGALGNGVRGRKLVVSLSPTMFQNKSGPDLTARYAGNVYPLQALTFLLNRELSSGMRQQFARRFLANPPMLDVNPVLGVLARMSADGRGVTRPAYYAFLPLAHAQRRLLEVQDKMAVLRHILTTPLADRHRSWQGPLDWSALVDDATAKYAPRTRGNRFGLDDSARENWNEWISSQQPSSDREFVQKMTRSECWIDLELLVQVLKELDARALILSMPFHGPFYDSSGVSAAARESYYGRVRQLTDRYGIRAVVQEDLEAEPYFFRDLGSHPSPKGWVFYDEVLDAFYHDALR